MTVFEGIAPVLAGALTKRGYTELTPVQTAMLEPRGGRRRSSGFRADRLRQDRGFRPCDGARTCWRGRAGSKRASDPLGGRGADARAGVAGPARTRMALCAGRSQNRVLRRWHGHAPGAPHAGGRRAYRRWNAGPPVRPHTARLPRHVVRARRWCSTKPTKCSTSVSGKTSNSFSAPPRRNAERSCSRRRCRNRSSSLAKRFQRNAIRISMIPENKQHADIEYRAVTVGAAERENAVINVLRYFEAAARWCSARPAKA